MIRSSTNPSSWQASAARVPVCTGLAMAVRTMDHAKRVEKGSGTR